MRGASSKCLCQQSCEALDFMFAPRIQNVLPGLCIDRQSAFSSEQRAAYICFSPEAEQRSNYSHVSVYLVALQGNPAELLFLSKLCLLPAPPNRRQKFRVIYLSWRFLFIYSPVIYTKKFTTGLQFSYSLSYFSDLKNPETQEELRGCFQDLWESLQFCSSASSSIHRANSFPASGGKTNFWHPDLAIPMGHRAGSVMCALKRIFALISI